MASFGRYGNPIPSRFGRNYSSPGQRAKKCFFQVFERLGGTTALLEWVQEDPKHKALFYGWIVKLLPKELDIRARGDEQLSPSALAVQAARAIIELEVGEQERFHLVAKQEAEQAGSISHAADTVAEQCRASPGNF